MNAKILTILVIFVTNFKCCQSRRYDNFTLFNVVPTDKEHLKFLQNLEQQKYIDIVFWKKPFKLYEDVQFIVNPTDRDLFRERANHYKIDAQVLLEDVQKAFDNQTVRSYLRLRVETFSWDHYHNLEDIYQWMADIALKFPNVVELESIGKSAEGRDIFAINVKKSTSGAKVIIEGGIHGNEWMSVAFVTYLINQIINARETNNKLLNDVANWYHWYFIPVVNPDGYDYSHKVDRLWRKNRRIVAGGIGVDLNRNFDYNFGKFGTSGDPKDDYYCGPLAFSESETQAVANFVTQRRENLKFYFAFHSYGQKIIIPYGDRIKHVENYSEMENYGKQAIMKMFRMTGVKYRVGTVYDTLGMRISGSSTSWVKKNHKVRYVFTLLLRDNGTHGFALPSEQILPTCKETLTGLLQMMTTKPRYVRSDLFNQASTIEDVLFTIPVCLICMLFK